MRRTGLLPELVNEAARPYEAGWSTAQIAERMNTDQRTVQRGSASKGSPYVEGTSHRDLEQPDR